MLHERALAHSRASVNVHGHRVPGPRGREGLREQTEFPFAPDENRVVGAPGGAKAWKRARLAPRERAARLARKASRPGLAGAAAGRALRDPWGPRPRSPREKAPRAAPSFGQDLERASDEGTAARQALEEHDSDAVPVARLRQASEARLLGRHVRGCARHRAGPRRTGRDEVDRQAEIEHDHPPLSRDQDVGGFQVLMELARPMKRLDPSSQLPQRFPQTSGVERIRGKRNSDPRRILWREGRDAGGRFGRPDLCRPLARGGIPRESGRAPNKSREGSSVDELHREEPPVPLRQELVERDEVGMHEIRERAELLLEEVQRGGVPTPQGLEGHDVRMLHIEDLIDDAVGARAQAPLDLEAVGAVELLVPASAHRNSHRAAAPPSRSLSWLSSTGLGLRRTRKLSTIARPQPSLR